MHFLFHRRHFSWCNVPCWLRGSAKLTDSLGDRNQSRFLSVSDFNPSASLTWTFTIFFADSISSRLLMVSFSGWVIRGRFIYTGENVRVAFAPSDPPAGELVVPVGAPGDGILCQAELGHENMTRGSTGRKDEEIEI